VTRPLIIAPVTASKRAEHLDVMRKEASDAIKLAEFSMATIHDNGKRIADICAGDYVFITFAKRNESGYTASGIKAPKLGPQRVGPFRVTEMAGPNACRIDIPSDWKIWPVISVRHLVKAPSTPDAFSRTGPAKIKPDDVAYEVEEVLDVRVMKGRKEYFVKWIGLPITRCEWVLPDTIEHARHLIDAFEEGLASKAIGKRKRVGTAGGAPKKKTK
jgi:hypothetical protein